jgi:hypothetical protein
MDDAVRNLAQLAVLALAGRKTEGRLADGERIYRIARENGLSGLVFPALGDDCLDADVRGMFRTDWLRYQAKDVAQKAAIEEIERVLTDAGIDRLYLKGTVLKDCYPASYMRSMGDIDILFRPEDVDRVHAILVKDLGYKAFGDSAAHDILGKDRDVMVEAHRSIDVESGEERWRIFADPWRHAREVENRRFAFEPEYFLLHLLRHLHKHLLSSGIGLRSVLDIGLYCSKYEQKMDTEILRDYLRSANLETFFGHVLVLCRKLFEFDGMDGFHQTGSDEETFVDEMVSYIALSGVHGKAEGANPQAVGLAKHAMNSEKTGKGMRGYLLHTLFPSRELLMYRYRYLQKHRWLLPWAWISRIFFKLTKDRKRTQRQLENLRVTDEEIASRSAFFQKMGL